MSDKAPKMCLVSLSLQHMRAGVALVGKNIYIFMCIIKIPCNCAFGILNCYN